jgi:hypothetical protein
MDVGCGQVYVCVLRTALQCELINRAMYRRKETIEYQYLSVGRAVDGRMDGSIERERERTMRHVAALTDKSLATHTRTNDGHVSSIQ